jgi:hypothetical protein
LSFDFTSEALKLKERQKKFKEINFQDIRCNRFREHLDLSAVKLSRDCCQQDVGS